MFVYRIGCSYTGWDVCIQDVMFVYRVGCMFTGWGVSIWDGGTLVYGMGC